MATTPGPGKHPDPHCVSAFISYAHKDEKLRVAFEEHLALLRSRKVVDSWTDRVIPAGGNWADAIHEQIERADVVILLVSSAFFQSGYITGVELKRALERHAAGEASVIPVILREGDYSGSPFAHLKELPIDGLAEGRSITGRRWKNRDEAFRNTTEGIRKEVERLRGRRLERQAVALSLVKQQREPSPEDREEIRGIGESFGRIVSGRTVLWVDDHPDNNALERAALESLGIGVTTSVSTEEALTLLHQRRFDLVISDWERGEQKPDQPDEGLRLLTAMRAARVFTAFLVYCGWLHPDALDQRRRDVAHAGGSGVTAAPRELLRWTVGELVRSAAFDPTAPFVEPPLYREE